MAAKLQLPQQRFNPHGAVLVLEWRVWPKYVGFCVDDYFFSLPSFLYPPQF
jgi:hypothetical protein